MSRLVPLLLTAILSSTDAAMPSANGRTPSCDTVLNLGSWRRRDAEIGRTGAMIELLRRAAYDGPAYVQRERGHRLFLHLLFRSYSPDIDATPDALARAYRAGLTIEERSRLAARADLIVPSLFIDDPEEWDRFQRARRRPALIEKRIARREAFAELVEGRGAQAYATKLRRELEVTRRSHHLVQFERLLREGAGDAMGSPPR